VIKMYVSGLAEGGGIPPQIATGGRLAETLFFGDAPGYSGYHQVNFRRPGSSYSERAEPISPKKAGLDN
jgi:hypothetical protein